MRSDGGSLPLHRAGNTGYSQVVRPRQKVALATAILIFSMVSLYMYVWVDSKFSDTGIGRLINSRQNNWHSRNSHTPGARHSIRRANDISVGGGMGFNSLQILIHEYPKTCPVPGTLVTNLAHEVEQFRFDSNGQRVTITLNVLEPLAHEDDVQAGSTDRISSGQLAMLAADVGLKGQGSVFLQQTKPKAGSQKKEVASLLGKAAGTWGAIIFSPGCEWKLCPGAMKTLQHVWSRAQSEGFDAVLLHESSTPGRKPSNFLLSNTAAERLASAMESTGNYKLPPWLGHMVASETSLAGVTESILSSPSSDSRRLAQHLVGRAASLDMFVKPSSGWGTIWCPVLESK